MSLASRAEAAIIEAGLSSGQLSSVRVSVEKDRNCAVDRRCRLILRTKRARGESRDGGRWSQGRGQPDSCRARRSSRLTALEHTRMLWPHVEWGLFLALSGNRPFDFHEGIQPSNVLRDLFFHSGRILLKNVPGMEKIDRRLAASPLESSPDCDKASRSKPPRSGKGAADIISRARLSYSFKNKKI